MELLGDFYVQVALILVATSFGAAILLLMRQKKREQAFFVIDAA